ncbi:Serine/threonine-protein kinase ppk5 [Schizosaccharomyces pombe]
MVGLISTSETLPKQESKSSSAPVSNFLSPNNLTEQTCSPLRAHSTFKEPVFLLSQRQYSHNSKILTELINSVKRPNKPEQNEEKSAVGIEEKSFKDEHLAQKKGLHHFADLKEIFLNKNLSTLDGLQDASLHDNIQSGKLDNPVISQNRRIVLEKLANPNSSKEYETIPTVENRHPLNKLSKTKTLAYEETINQLDETPGGTNYLMNKKKTLSSETNKYEYPQQSKFHECSQFASPRSSIVNGPRTLGKNSKRADDTARMASRMKPSNYNNNIQSSSYGHASQSTKLTSQRDNDHQKDLNFSPYKSIPLNNRPYSPMSEIVGFSGSTTPLDTYGNRPSGKKFNENSKFRPPGSTISSYSSASTLRRLPRAPGSKVHAERQNSTFNSGISLRALRKEMGNTAPVSSNQLLKDADLVMENLSTRNTEKVLHEVNILKRLRESCVAITAKSYDTLDERKIRSLTTFEYLEIKNFQKIYFTGSENCQKLSKQIPLDECNEALFDDDNGDYKAIPGDHLLYRYEIIDTVGKGSFGQVLKCIDHKRGQVVAIKVIKNRQKFHGQTLVEVGILKRLCEADPADKNNVIRYLSHFDFRGHLCIVTELLGSNLFDVIRENNYKGLPLIVVKSFALQGLQALRLLQGQKIIHCDLKPENLLLSHPLKARIKLIDFGSSCFYNEKVYTYLQSRFYRAPEIILGLEYGKEIDIWSFGCILAELFTGVPLFPGGNETEQLGYIMEVLGPPPMALIRNSTRSKAYFDSEGKPHPITDSHNRLLVPSTRTFSQLLNTKQASFLDFLSKCLKWDPKDRITVDSALQHEFILGKTSQKPMVSKGSHPLPDLPV